MLSLIIIGIGLALIGYFVYTNYIACEDDFEDEFEESSEKKKKERVEIDPSTMKYGPVNIYFASQTGTAEGFAEDLREEGSEKEIWCEVINVKDFDAEQFKKSKLNIFVIATHYEGEPPDDAVEWWEWVEGAKKSGLPEVQGNKFTVFALGDLTYKFYCKMGKSVDEAMEQFGMERVYNLGLGSNDQNNIEEFFEEWKIPLWSGIMEHLPQNPNYNPNAAASSGVSSGTKFKVEELATGEETPLEGLDSNKFDLNAGKYINGHFGKVLSVIELRQKSTDTNSTLEIELEYKGKVPYTTAGNLNIFPENSEENVKKALQCVGL